MLRDHSKQLMNRYFPARVSYSLHFNAKLRTFGLIMGVTYHDEESKNGRDLIRDIRTVKNAALDRADFES